MSLILSLFLSLPFSVSEARYISCLQINCDCSNINAGILNIGWVPDCRQKEKNLKLECEKQGHWTPDIGFCGPNPHGPQAFPTDKNSQSVYSEAQNIVSASPPRPMKLIYTVLPHLGLSSQSGHSEKIFAELNDEFAPGANALWDMWNTLGIMIVQGQKDTFLHAGTQNVLVQQLQLIVEQLLLIQERLQKNINTAQAVYDLLPESKKDQSVEANVLLVENLIQFMADLDQWNQLIFDLYQEVLQLYEDAFSSETSRLDLEKAKALRGKTYSILAENPWNKPAGVEVMTLVKELNPELVSVIEFSWTLFQLR